MCIPSISCQLFILLGISDSETKLTYNYQNLLYHHHPLTSNLQRRKNSPIFFLAMCQAQTKNLNISLDLYPGDFPHCLESDRANIKLRQLDITIGGQEILCLYQWSLTLQILYVKVPAAYPSSIFILHRGKTERIFYSEKELFA